MYKQRQKNQDKNSTNAKMKLQAIPKQQSIFYKYIIEPIWTYGIELRGCSKLSNTKILQTPHSKTMSICLKPNDP